jgi:ubiquinone biosynthesis protein
MLAPQHGFRLLSILWVLARHDIFPLLQDAGVPKHWLWWGRLVPKKTTGAPKGSRLALALQALGPTYIKLGQTLATRYDLLGEDFAEDLALLQDRLPPFSMQEARRILESSLKQPLEQCFTSFTEEPVAAASIAQVHRATTLQGDDVAVKILRPGVRHAFAKDIAFLYAIARFCHRWIPPLRRLKLVDVIRALEKSTLKELDLRLEAAAAEEIQAHTADYECVRIPKIFWSYTTGQILTSSWEKATPFTQLDLNDLHEETRQQLALQFLEHFCVQILKEGLFHADLHTGNLLLDDQQRIVMVDFGITGRLDFESRLYLARIADGFLKRDYDYVAQIHYDAGYIPRHQDIGDFALACRAIAEPILDQPIEKVSIGELLGQLFYITRTFDMATQPQLIMLQKSLILVEAFCRRLAPEVNIWKMTESTLLRLAGEHLGMQAQIKHHKALWQQRLHRIPELLETIIERLDAAPPRQSK